CLGELGKIILLEDRSRTQPLTQTDVDKVFGKQSPLLRLSVQLGWLIPQGVVVASYWQRGYIFFDPTFQDYFTALSIEDWRFFLDTNSHCYRLFEAPWQRVMMLWWGRKDVKNTEKEAFLAALFNFNDHCGVGNFYGKRAQILTAIALQEFKESEQSEQVLTTLLNWCKESNSTATVLRKLAENIFEKIDSRVLLSFLLTWLKNAEEEAEYRQICRYLVQWGVGNPMAIAGLEEQLKTLEHSSLRFQVAETLGSIAPGNSTAIQVFSNALKDRSAELPKKPLLLGLAKVGRGQESVIQGLLALFPQNLTPQQFRVLAPCLEIIGQDNQGVIARLQQFLRVNESGSLRCQIAECLERVDPGSPAAISVLVRLLQKNVAADIRQQALYSLGEVSAGQQTVIAALIRFLETDEDIFTRWLAVTSLAKVGQGHQGAIAVLEKQLQTVNTDLSDETNRGFVKEVVDALVKIDPQNPLLLQSLSQLLHQQTDTETTQDCAALLGKLDPGNPEAIAALVALTKNDQDEFTQRQAAASLGKIDPGNLKAVMALISLMQNSSSKDIRATAAASLGEIGNGNPVAIAALIRTVSLAKDKAVQKAGVLSLGKIGTNNKEVAQTLLDLLAVAQDDRLCPELGEQIVRVLPRKMLQSAIYQLRDTVFPPTSLRAQAHWQVLWHCAQFVPYPVFYQAWHQRPLSAGESLSSSFGFGGQTSVVKNNPHQYLRQALMDVIQASPDLMTAQVIWIDCDHFLEPNNPSIDIYDQMLSQGCPEFDHGIPDNLAKLRLYWHGIQRHQNKQTYILLFDHVSGDSLLPLNPDFVEKLTTFQGAIAFLTEQNNLPLTHFLPQSSQVITAIIEWIKSQLNE
ncbi:MAG: HEAT repeat domain-containing protein, partial [Microcystaceae cyanobacterium]